MRFNRLNNLALGKNARQSSTSRWSQPDDASRALSDDGKRDFAFHTDIEENPWWQVDLEGVYPIYYIVIGNRRKTGQEKAITLTVETSLYGEVWQIIHTGVISWDDDLTWPLGGLISARFVRLSLREKTHFHLAKVEVWGFQEGGLKPKFKMSNLLWAEIKKEGLQELHAVLTKSASLTEMILDLGDFYPIWALELAAPPKTSFKGFKDLKIEYSVDGYDWRTIHEGEVFWTGRLYYPLQGEIMAHFIKISRSTPVKKTSGLRHIFRSLLHRLSCRRDWPFDWPSVKVFIRSQSELQVRALRNDGFGGRMMALLNAMYMAKLLGCDYKFVWQEHNIAAKVPNSLISLDDAQNTFDADFLQDHLLSDERASHVSKISSARSLCRRHFTRADKQDRPNIIHAMHYDPSYLYHLRLVPSGSCFKSLFEGLLFSPTLQEVIAMARRVEVPPNYIAIHVRSGELVFSKMRNEILYWQAKLVPLPVVKLTLEKLRGENRPVILFGQDTEELAYLAGSYKTSHATDYLPSRTLTPSQRDLFEIVLMSRASRIYTCLDSYYACCAAWIGGNVKRIELHEVASSEEKTAYLKTDLERNAACYHPFHNSFAYLYLYHLNHLTADQEELAFYLKQAKNYDPKNEVINILQAAECFKHHNEKAGEELLATWLKLDFDLEQQTLHYKSNAFLKQALSYNYFNFHIKNYLQPLEAAAQQGQPNAAAVMSIMYRLGLPKHKECDMPQAMYWQKIALDSYFGKIGGGGWPDRNCSPRA